MMPSALFIISATLFCLGLYGALTRRNAVAILLAIELMLNSAALNFVTVARWLDPQQAGQPVAFFVIALAACEAVVGLAIIIAVYRQARSIMADELHLLQG